MTAPLLAVAPRPLWSHQRDALAAVQRYLSQAATAPAGAALVRMPTGTGKGGVIAGIARATSAVQCTLVVTPSIALRDQIVDEAAGVPWATHASAAAWDPLTATAVVGSTARAALPPAGGDGRRRMLALTTTALVDIAEHDPALYDALRSATDVLVFDEGHREPAPRWAEAIRGLAAPVVLLTATPCRNDHELFHINPAHTYVLPYGDALVLGLLRRVEFQRYPFARDPEHFAAAFHALLMSDARGYADGLAIPTVPGAYRDRAIVRCGSFAAVEAVATALEALDVPMLALHDRYRGRSRAGRTSDVPPRGARGEAVVWVAENKLIEGIDDAAFRLLGVFDGFGDSRALVQQIGRVTRRHSSDPAADTAIVLIADDSDEETRWAEYLAYETQAATAPAVFGARDLAQAVVRQVPPALYLDRRYRTPFDLAAPDAHDALNYPAHATVGRVVLGFDRGECREAVADELRRAGADVHIISRDGDEADVLLYLVARSARVIRVGFWPEYDLHVLVLARRGNYLFCTDTGRHLPDAVRARTRRVSRAELERLLATQRHRIEEVALVHTRPGPGAVRRRALRMDSLDGIAGDVDDPLQTCQSARAVLESTADGRRRRRYVGFGRDRISEPSRRDMGYGEYLAWIEESEAALSGSGPRPRCLARYALDVDAAGLQPTGLDLAVADLASCFATPIGEPLELETTSYVVAPSGRCTLDVRSAGGVRSFPCRLRWRADARAGQGAFELSAPDLDAAFVARAGSDADGRAVCAYVNGEQRFTVHFADGGLVYTGGAHHRIGRLVRGPDGFWLGNHLETVPGLDRELPEKGRVVSSAQGPTWDEASIFGLIDRRGNVGPHAAQSALRDRLATATLLVCDDMGDEAADFIAADETAGWVAFVHAKARKTRRSKGGAAGGVAASGARRLSAASLGEVCSQAEKNLYHFIDDANALAERAAGWDTPWPDKQRPRIPRLRLGATSGAEAHRRLARLLRAASVRREVWIVCSGAFSAAELRRRREEPNAPLWVRALETKLQTTAAAVRGAGARFRFFCAP